MALFQPETPSRVLRRIEDLNQQSLPDLPGLPADQTSFSEDGDSTVAHSPPARKPGSPLLPPPLSPYTSTPAPSSATAYHRSNATIVPSTISTRYGGSGNDTTATARPPPQLDSLRRPSSPRYNAQVETTLEDTMSEIGKDASSVGAEDMLVVSEDESEHSHLPAHPLVDSMELSELPDPNQGERDTSLDDETTRDEGESSNHHPLESFDSQDQKHANVEQEQEPDMKQMLPAALSPLRERDLNSTIASPELGRNYSPKHSLSYSLQDDSHSSDQTLSRSVDKTPTAALTPHRHATPALDSPLQNMTPATPLVSQTDAARRANHLLTSLRSTAKPRFVRGTPHPLQSARRVSDSSLARIDEDQRSVSSFTSEHSSNDLTTFHQKANTSLPSGGSADIGGGATATGSRFNGAKLNAYLHQLNTHLTDENQQLVKTLKKTTEDNERLQFTIREMSVAGGISVDLSNARWRTRENSQGEQNGDDSRIELLGKELEGLVEGQRKIRGLQDQFGEGQLREGMKDGVSKIQDLEEQLERMQGHLEDKDDEIRKLRDQIVSNKASSLADSSTGTLVSELQQEVFELKDALDTTSSDRDAAQADLIKLQADFTAAGQASEKDFGDMQARIDSLLEELNEKDNEVEEVKQLLVEQETEFADKMQQLEAELSKVMEEQEHKVEAARAELELKRRQDDIARSSEKEALEQIKAERDTLQQRFDEKGSQTSGAALQEEIASLREDLLARDEELARMQEELEAAEDRGDPDHDLELLKEQMRLKDDEIQQLEGALDESANQLLQNEDDLAALRQQLSSEKQIKSSLSAQISQLSVVKAKSPLGNEAYNGNQDDVIATLEEELEEARQEIVQLHERLAATNAADRSAEVRDLEMSVLETTKADLEDRVKSLRQQISLQFSPNKQTPDKSWLLRPLPAVRTPKTPGQFLSNLPNWSPGSAANETISPLLAQIHELEQLVEHLQAQLVAANAQIDNKLDRLEAAGFDTISIAKQLSAAQTRTAELEAKLERLLGEDGSIEKARTRLTRIRCPDCSTTFDANKVVQLRVDQSGISFDGYTAQGKAIESVRSELATAYAKNAELKTQLAVSQAQVSRVKELADEKATLLAHQDALSKDLQQARDNVVVLETELRTERSRLRTLTSEHAAIEKAKASLETRIAKLETGAKSCSCDAAEIETLRTALRAKEAEHRKLQDERGDILRGVANLQSDMNRVRQEAISLGLDLAGVRRERDEFAQRQNGDRVASQGLDLQAIEDLRVAHKQESKGLLVLVRSLKLRVNREVGFRHQAGVQKQYLAGVVQEKQATIDSIMAQLGLPVPTRQRAKPSLKSAALAVCALSRMRRSSQQWKEDSAPKKRLREQAYPRVRGKPFPTSSLS
ncbi:uncharacterized protein JCM15063_000752 [Sporobolomyces koalae]|uniref:uncharacterized protein n=1 Tax=Sporobolomyces koalae TaxID=500713 RepID=UPI00316B06EC